MAEYYTDKQLPGVGISIGLTRLFSVLEAQGYLNDALVTAPADVLILPMTEELSPAISFATALRDAGVRAQLHCEKKKFKQKLSYADKLSIPYAAFLGEDEIQQNKVTVKDLTTGQQQTVTAGRPWPWYRPGWRPGRAVLPSRSRRPDGTFSPCPRLNGENPTYRRKCSMKKQLIALALSTALLAGSSAAIAPEEAFPAVNTYPGFADVAGSAWYAATVQTCYEVGLMTGTGAGFAPRPGAHRGRGGRHRRPHERGHHRRLHLPGGFHPALVHLLCGLSGEAGGGGARSRQAGHPPGVHRHACRRGARGYADPHQPDHRPARHRRRRRAVLLQRRHPHRRGRLGHLCPRQDPHPGGDRRHGGPGRPAGAAGELLPADYAMFTAAYLKPADVLFTNGVTAGQYLPYVQTLIDGLEADCAAQGMEFNWFNTVDGVIFLDYVEDTALAHFGVTAKDGTQLYKDFDMQVYYSRYLDQKG